MHGELAGLAERALDDRDQVALVVDVSLVKADRLADPHPADRQQADQRASGRRGGVKITEQADSSARTSAAL